MPKQDDFYTFALVPHVGARPTPVEIRLPRVTAIIGNTLAKPALTAWNYRFTRDVLSGYVSVLRKAGNTANTILDTLEDADMLEEALKANRLRPEDHARDAAEGRGAQAHAFLATLVDMDSNDADALASDKVHGSSALVSGVTFAIATWWLEAQPLVVASEKTLYSLRHGFAGTVDLVWFDKKERVLTDLKTRKPDIGMYESDDLQTAAYEGAWNEMYPDSPIDRRTILVAREDGSHDEYPATRRYAAFVALKAVYDELQGKGA